MSFFRNWIRRSIAFVVAVMFVILAADFNQQWIELSRLKTQLDADKELLDDLISKRDYLLIQKDYSSSDKAVEEFAREDRYMAKPGDTVIVVLPSEDQPETSTRKLYSDFNEDQSNLKKWLFWLFGDD